MKSQHSDNINDKARQQLNWQIAQTLATIITPGKRSRISPFVEAAQYFCLFDESIIPARRYEHMAEILHEHKQHIKNLAEQYTNFVKKGKIFSGTYNAGFLDVYMAYYLPVNVAKLQIIMIELARRQQIPEVLNVVDLGVGTGTTALALFDFLLAWSNVCSLYNIDFPVHSVRFKGVDESSDCLDYARKAVEGYRKALSLTQFGNSDTFISLMQEWLDACEWVEGDINRKVNIENDNGRVLLVASNIFNELEEPARENLKEMLDQLPKGSLSIFIEPGAKEETIELNRWRRQLFKHIPSLQSLGPCGQEFGNNLPWQCKQCWNSRRESFHQPLLYKKFRDECNKILPDKRGAKSFDDYENNLLSWSYILIGKDVAPVKEIFPNGKDLLRYVGTFSKYCEDGEYMPAAACPDESPSAKYYYEEKRKFEIKEFLKF